MPWGEGNEGEQIDYGNDPPKAILNYNPDPAVMAFHRSAQGTTYDDSRAEKEWGWKPVFSLAGMVGDFYEELEAHPEWYRGEGIQGCGRFAGAWNSLAFLKGMRA